MLADRQSRTVLSAAKRGMNGQAERERGSGTVLALSLILILLTCLVVIAGIIGAVSAHHRALSAADLSALAAADTARGLREGNPCDVAVQVAQANSAELVNCAQPEGLSGTVDIRVSTDIKGPFALLGPAEGISGAGPAG